VAAQQADDGAEAATVGVQFPDEGLDPDRAGDVLHEAARRGVDLRVRGAAAVQQLGIVHVDRVEILVGHDADPLGDVGRELRRDPRGGVAERRALRLLRRLHDEHDAGAIAQTDAEVAEMPLHPSLCIDILAGHLRFQMDHVAARQHHERHLHLEMAFDIDGQPLMVYAVMGVPDRPDGSVPGLLHIHGGSQTASIETVRFFVPQGYAVLSFDWTGPTPTRSGKFSTVFPDSIPPVTEYDVPLSRARIAHIVWMARRGLTLLAGQSEVDSSRLGVFGISWGGLASWLVNGTDTRVRAAVPLFGCGIPLETPENEAWRTAFQPEQWIESQHGDVCFLNATNDFFGHLETLERFWEELRVDKRLGLGANENHGLEEALKVTGRKWLDAKLKNSAPLPPAPELTLDLEDGGLWAEVHAPEASRIRIFYAVSPDGTRPDSYWYLGPWGSCNDGFFSARWRFPIGSRRASVYAEAEYEDGSKLCSMPQDVFEKIGTISLENFDASVWYDPRMGVTPWYTQWEVRGTGLHPGIGNMRVTKSRDDGRLCLMQTFHAKENRFYGILRRPACPVLGAGQGSSFFIEYFCPSGGELRIKASSAVANQTFQSLELGQLEIHLRPGEGWRKITISNTDWSDFNFSQIRQIELDFLAEDFPGLEIGGIALVE